jgi:hypothetical protein
MKPHKCPMCDGLGNSHASYYLLQEAQPCKHCNGTGVLVNSNYFIAQTPTNRGYEPVEMDCQYCKGSGVDNEKIDLKQLFNSLYSSEFYREMSWFDFKTKVESHLIKLGITTKSKIVNVKEWENL